MSHHSTRTTFEVEIDLSGTFTKGYPASRDDPGADDEVDDLEVEGMFALRSIPGWKSRSGGHEWERVNILDGLDKVAKDRIAANILAFLGDDEPAQLIIAEALS